MSVTVNRAALVEAIAGLNTDLPTDPAGNPEYLRGQLELASDVLGLHADCCRDAFEAEVLAAVQRDVHVAHEARV